MQISRDTSRSLPRAGTWITTPLRSCRSRPWAKCRSFPISSRPDKLRLLQCWSCLAKQLVVRKTGVAGRSRRAPNTRPLERRNAQNRAWRREGLVVLEEDVCEPAARHPRAERQHTGVTVERATRCRRCFENADRAVLAGNVRLLLPREPAVGAEVVDVHVEDGLGASPVLTASASPRSLARAAAVA